MFQFRFYNHGGCLLGIAPNTSLAWADFNQVDEFYDICAPRSNALIDPAQSFSPTDSIVTVYIPQESTTYSSWVWGIELQLIDQGVRANRDRESGCYYLPSSLVIIAREGV
jgi:hypothetical protein